MHAILDSQVPVGLSWPTDVAQRYDRNAIRHSTIRNELRLDVSFVSLRLPEPIAGMSTRSDNA